MASLFTGTPLTATDYSTASADTPKWLQDAIYNQVQMANVAASAPYQAYNLPTVAGLSPLQVQSNAQVASAQGAWNPAYNTAQTGMKGFTTAGTAEDLKAAQAPYLQQQLVGQNLNAGQDYFNQAGGMNVSAAGQPYFNQSATTTAQALSDKALSAANPYLSAAAQTSTQNIGQYMNPYQTNAMDALATQGARNLSEKFLPEISDSFVKAGQFGGNRMGEFASRALRDTQEGVLNQQAQMANTGYANALQASQADLARQAQLANTVGSISGADLSRVLSGAQQYGNLGQTAGSLANSQMQNITSLGQNQTAAGQAQQTFGLNAATADQAAQAQDYTRQMSALNNVASLASSAQGLNMSDAAALASAGQSQQVQTQQQLDAAKALYDAQLAHPKSQLDWLSTQVRGMAPNVNTVTTKTGGSTGATYSPSPLAQVASGIGVYKALTAP
jgi:hypothetical protein